MSIPRRALVILTAVCLAGAALAACEDVDDPGQDDPGEPRGPTAEGVTYSATVKSSVALLPLAKKAADVVDRPPGVEVDVRATSSEDALASLCAGRIEVALSNRGMSDAERRVCGENGIRPIGAVVAHQVVAIHRHEGLDVRCLTTRQLRRLWRPGSDVQRYSELAPGLPDRPVRLIAYPPRSAAFEFFARKITGAERPLREDARRVADRLDFESIVRETPGGLAFAPYDAPRPDEQRLALVAVDGGGGCVRPTVETVRSGHTSLSPRPCTCTPPRVRCESARSRSSWTTCRTRPATSRATRASSRRSPLPTPRRTRDREAPVPVDSRSGGAHAASGVRGVRAR